MDETLHQSGVKNGHSNEKVAEKPSLFFSSLAKSAMNWCLVAVFFLIGIGFICKKNFRKTFQRLLGRILRCFCEQLTFSITEVLTHFVEFLKIYPKMFPFSGPLSRVQGSQAYIWMQTVLFLWQRLFCAAPGRHLCTNIARNAIATYTNFFFFWAWMNFFFFQPQHAASEGLWSLPARCLSRSFPENVLNKHTFGTMALKGEEISSAKNQTLLVKVQQPLRKTPESRAPENPTSPHVWPIQNVCLPQHISTFFYPFRWSQLIDHERALSTDSREGRPFVQTTRTGSKANKRSAKQVPFAPN